MANVLKSLKTRFPEIYDLLLKNQKENSLIFFGPNKLMYARDSLNDKEFYYHHIFQKSKYDPSLFTNLYGKVLKTEDGKTFKTYIGWTEDMTINIIERSINDDGLFFFQIDGVCMEQYSKILKIKLNTNVSEYKRCQNSVEYVKYYTDNFINKFDNTKNNEKDNDFIRGIKSLKSFITVMKNNYLLIKGYEYSYYNIFNKKINKLFSAFSIIFNNNNIVAREFVDSYVFYYLYDNIIAKLTLFYFDEAKNLKLKVHENLDKYGVIELNLDEVYNKLNFSEIYENLDNLKNCRCYFEKINCLVETNKKLMNQCKKEYESKYVKKFEAHGDFMISIWIYILAHYNYINNMFIEAMFLNFFNLNKGYEENDYVIKNFISAMETIKKENLKIEEYSEESDSIQPIKVSSFSNFKFGLDS